MEFSSASFVDLLQNIDWFKAPQNARNVIPDEQLLPAQDALYVVVLLVSEVPYFCLRLVSIVFFYLDETHSTSFNPVDCLHKPMENITYRGADKSLARPGRNKLMFMSEWREFPPAPCLAGKKLDDSSCLDVVETARVPLMPTSLFPSWSG